MSSSNSQNSHPGDEENRQGKAPPASTSVSSSSTPPTTPISSSSSSSDLVSTSSSASPLPLAQLAPPTTEAPGQNGPQRGAENGNANETITNEASNDDDSTSHLDDDVNEVQPTTEELTTIIDERGRRRSGRQQALMETNQHQRELIDISSQEEHENRTTRGRRQTRETRQPRGRPRRNRALSSNEVTEVSSEHNSPIRIDSDHQTIRRRQGISAPPLAANDPLFRDPFRRKRVRFDEEEQRHEVDDVHSSTPSLTMDDIQDNLE